MLIPSAVIYFCIIPESIFHRQFEHSSMLYAHSTHPVFGGILNIILTSSHKLLLKLLVSLFLYSVYGNKLVVKIYIYICKKKKNFASVQKVCPEVFYKTDVHKHFRSSCPVCLRPATLLKMRFWHRCFPVNFVKFLRISYFTEHLWWLLLTFCKIYRKYCCWSLFLIKVFSCKFCKNVKTSNLLNACQK